jgi:hypothetical protein
VTLLTIVQDACSVVPVAIPASVVGNTDETAVLALGLANMVGRELAGRVPGGWVNMIREYTWTSVATTAQAGTITNVGGVAVIGGLSGISSVTANTWVAFGTGVPANAVIIEVTTDSVTINQPTTEPGAGVFAFGQSDYVLPTDFQRPVDDTFWDRSKFWEMRGPLSPQQWQLYKSSRIGNATIQQRFRFRNIRDLATGNSLGQMLSLDPTPLGGTPAGDTGFAIGISAVGIGALGAAGDNTGFTIGSSAIGIGSIGESIAPDLTLFGGQLVFEYVSNGWCQSSAGVPQTRWTADTDTGIIDEHLMTLGLIWRMQRRLGLSSAEEQDEYERAVSRAISADGGAPVLNMTPRGLFPLLGPYNIPETGFGGISI